MAEYTPNDEDMREKYLWAHAREAEGVAEQSYALQVCGEVWDAWLAAHDRAVARAALDGLAEWAGLRVREAITDKGADDWRRTRFAVVAHRDTHYPETED